MTTKQNTLLITMHYILLICANSWKKHQHIKQVLLYVQILAFAKNIWNSIAYFSIKKSCKIILNVKLVLFKSWLKFTSR